MTAPAREPRDTGATSGLTSGGGAAAAADGSPTSGRLDLDVPYAEKYDAKRLGARWDPVTHCWYVPLGSDPAPLIDTRLMRPSPPAARPFGPVIVP